MRYGIGAALVIFALAAACAKPAKAPEGILFKDDLAFLKAHTKVVVLGGADGQAQVAVNPDIQGRVMTSTAGGPDGLSFGWINREFIASGVNNPHMNAFGGEDRFWLGPEGGQFSIFFKKGDPFDLEHWWTPPAVNEGSFDIAAQDAGRIHLPQDDPPRELFGHGVRSRGQPGDPPARRRRSRGPRRPRPGGRQDGRLRLR